MINLKFKEFLKNHSYIFSAEVLFRKYFHSRKTFFRSSSENTTIVDMDGKNKRKAVFNKKQLVTATYATVFMRDQ